MFVFIPTPRSGVIVFRELLEESTSSSRRGVLALRLRPEQERNGQSPLSPRMQPHDSAHRLSLRSYIKRPLPLLDSKKKDENAPLRAGIFKSNPFFFFKRHSSTIQPENTVVAALRKQFSTCLRYPLSCWLSCEWSAMRFANFLLCVLAVAVLSICVQGMHGTERHAATDKKRKAAIADGEGSAVAGHDLPANMYKQIHYPSDWEDEGVRARWPEPLQILWEERKKAEAASAEWQKKVDKLTTSKKSLDAERSNSHSRILGASSRLSVVDQEAFYTVEEAQEFRDLWYDTFSRLSKVLEEKLEYTKKGSSAAAKGEGSSRFMGEKESSASIGLKSKTLGNFRSCGDVNTWTEKAQGLYRNWLKWKREVEAHELWFADLKLARSTYELTESLLKNDERRERAKILLARMQPKGPKSVEKKEKSFSNAKKELQKAGDELQNCRFN